jgi:hypothetical protein
MNCSTVRELLAGTANGEPTAEDRTALEAHLVGCADCRREREALTHVRRLLDAAPAPMVQVDVAALHAEALRREVRRARRWRRLAASMAAAALVLVCLWRLDVRLERHQLTLSWGEAPAPVQPPASTVNERRDNSAVEERLKLLNELVQAIALDVETRDLRQQAAVTELQAQLAQVRAEAVRARAVNEQDVSTLTQYLQTVLKEKGGQP